MVKVYLFLTLFMWRKAKWTGKNVRKQVEIWKKFMVWWETCVLGRWDKTEAQWDGLGWKLRECKRLQTRNDIQYITGWVLMHAHKTDFKINYLEKVRQLTHIINQ